MKTNVGGIDRILRIFAGLVLIGLAAGIGTPWTWIGVLPLVTGVVGSCPAYSLIGLSTCPAKKHA
ncbi:MAG: YgaP family membrane protein [Pseudomonadota bacterium]